VANDALRTSSNCRKTDTMTVLGQFLPGALARRVAHGAASASLILWAPSAAAQGELDCNTSVPIFFDRDSSAIYRAGFSLIEIATERIAKCHASQVTVYGYVDPEEGNNNTALGEKRAKAVAEQLRLRNPNVNVVTFNAATSESYGGSPSFDRRVLIVWR
jgi:outer membrane protein OmpA-like peptidoglycan-associated protein